jgi:hypothetical protein
MPRRRCSARVAHGPAFVFRTSQLLYSPQPRAFAPLGIPNGLLPLGGASVGPLAVSRWGIGTFQVCVGGGLWPLAYGLWPVAYMTA